MEKIIDIVFKLGISPYLTVCEYSFGIRELLLKSFNILSHKENTNLNSLHKYVKHCLDNNKIIQIFTMINVFIELYIM